jgi:hypothetical protein
MCVDTIKIDIKEIGWHDMDLWSSGQSSWLQILKSSCDSRRYQIF